MGANISNQKQVKIDYLPDVVKILDNTVTVRRLAIKTDAWTGDRKEWRVHLTRSGAVRYSEDGGAFPIAGNQTYDLAYAFRKAIHGKIEITDMAIATIRDDANSFISAMKSEMGGLTEEMKIIENWFAFRDGTGVVCELTDTSLASGTTTIPVTDGRFLKQFRGSAMEFEVYDTTLATLRGTVTVSLVANTLDASGYALCTFSAQVAGATAGDKLVMGGSLNRAVTGLDKLVDDSASTFQNINVAAYPEYSSLVFSNSGTNRDLTPALLRRFLAARRKKSGQKGTSKTLDLLGTSSMIVNFEEFYEGELRVDTSTKVGGLAVSSFQSALGKVNLQVDDDMLYNTLIGADFGDIVRGTQKELHWRRPLKGGGGIFTPSQQSAKFEATCLEFCDYYIKKRTSSCKLEDLNEDKETSF